MSALLQIHNILRWVILLLMLFSLVQSFLGWSRKRELREADVRLFLFTLIAAHTTLLIGLILLLFGRFGILSSGLPPGVELMKDRFYRFFWVEHPTGMILAVILITVGRGAVKKQIPDPVKYKKVFWFFLAALILILATIPWPGREIVGRSM